MHERIMEWIEEKTYFSPSVFTLTLVFAMLCVFLHGRSDWQASVLFMMPFFQFVILWRVGKKEKGAQQDNNSREINYVLNCFVLILAVSLAPYMVFWLVFSTERYKGIPGLPYVPVVFVVGLMSLTVYFMHILMDKDPKGRCKLLRGTMQRHSFLTISFFFGSFLSVVYLLSFAFAFEDRQQRQENVVVGEEGRVGLHVNSEIAVWKRVFRGAKPDHHEQGLLNHHENQIHSLLLFGKNTSAVHVNFNLGDEFDAENSLEYIEGFNARRLRDLRNAISNVVEREVKDAPNAIRLAISLIGHTSEPTPSGDPFISNYELSDARVRQVQRTLLSCLVSGPRRMALPAIEWHLVPISREDDFLQETDALRGRVLRAFADPSRSVEICIYVIDDDFAWQQAKYLARRNSEREREEDTSIDQLTLLDYVYFTVYTVTTTGYGDIVPVSEFSLFLATLANIIELFYLVVFFNVLVSTSQGSWVRRADGKEGLEGG